MNIEILRVLRADAAAYWRHRELRRSGERTEARRLERASIRRDIGYLRTALSNPNAYVSCSGRGTIIHLGQTTVSLYAPVERFPLASLAIRLGRPQAVYRSGHISTLPNASALVSSTIRASITRPNPTFQINLNIERRPAMARSRTSKFDASEAITNELIRIIERGVLPWRKPWTAGGSARPLRHNSEPYQGVNNFLLTMRTVIAGYASPFWMTIR